MGPWHPLCVGMEKAFRVVLLADFRTNSALSSAFGDTVRRGLARGAMGYYRCQKFPTRGRYRPMPRRTEEENSAPVRGELDRQFPGSAAGKVSTIGRHA